MKKESCERSVCLFSLLDGENEEMKLAFDEGYRVKHKVDVLGSWIHSGREKEMMETKDSDEAETLS